MAVCYVCGGCGVRLFASEDGPYERDCSRCDGTGEIELHPDEQDKLAREERAQDRSDKYRGK